MEMTIFVLGDMEFSYRILLGINMLYQSKVMHLAAAILLILYIFWAYIKYMLNPEHSPYPFREFAFGIIFYMIFGGIDYISPRFDVRLETDVYQGRTYETRIVPDVPLLAVAPAWLATNFFKGLRETISPLLYVPGEHTGEQYPGMSSGLDPLALLTQLNGMSSDVIIDQYVAKNIKEYIDQCYLPLQQMGATPGSDTLDETLKKPVNLFFNDLNVNVNWLFTKIYSETVKEGTVTACSDAYPTLKTELNGPFKTKVENYLTSRGITSNDIRLAHQTVVAAFTNPVYPDPYDFMVGKFAAIFLNESLLDSGIPTFVAMSNKMMFEASQKRVFDRAAESNLFIQIMVPAITAIEAFAFFIAPVLMMLTVLGGVGVAYIGKYLMLTLFINLWGFIKIFTDYFMLVTVKKAFVGDLTLYPELEPFSLLNQYHTFLEVENFLAIAASLTTAIPLFAMFLLYGGVHSMMGVMRAVSGGTADASNLAPTLGTSGNAGLQQFGDVTSQHVMSTGGKVNTHAMGVNNDYGVDTITNDVNTAKAQLVSQGKSELISQSSALGKSVNSLFQHTDSGGKVTTSGNSSQFTLSSGSEKVNSLSEQFTVGNEKTSSETASAQARVAAAVALQLKFGGGKPKGPRGEFSNDQIDEALSVVSKGVGVGADVSALAVKQLSHANGETFKESVNKAMAFVDSDKSGKQFNQGFNWASVDNQGQQSAISDAASKITTNTQAITSTQSRISQANEALSDASSVSQTRQANWAYVVSAFQGSDKGDPGGGFRQVFNDLNAETQGEIFQLHGVQNGNFNDLLTNLNKDIKDKGFEFGDSTAMIKSLKNDFHNLKQYDEVADIYAATAKYAGDGGRSFTAAAAAFSNLDTAQQYVNKNQVAPPNIGDVTLNSGAPKGSAEIKEKATAGTTATPTDNATSQAQDANLATETGAPTTQGNNIRSGVNLDPNNIAGVVAAGDRQSSATNEFDNVASLRTGMGIINGMASGLEKIGSAIFDRDVAMKWGLKGDEWKGATAGVAAQAGFASGAMSEGLLTLAQGDVRDFAPLKDELAKNDVDAYQRLSGLNDAALFLTNTNEGQTALNALPEDDRKAVLSNIKQVEGMVNSLGNSSPITKTQMNEISKTRLSGDITDSQAGALIDLAVSEPGSSESSRFFNVASLGDDTKSLLMSAANGNIADNPVLSDMLSNNQSQISNSSFWNANKDYTPVSEIISTLKQGPYESENEKPSSNKLYTVDNFTIDYSSGVTNSEMYNDYAMAHDKDIIKDSIGVNLRAGSLMYNEGSDVVQGFNMEMASDTAVANMVNGYYSVISNEGYENHNANIISDAKQDTLLSKAVDFVYGNGISRNANALAFAAASTGNLDFSERFINNGGEPSILQQGWQDLGGQAKDAGIAIDKNVYEALDVQMRKDVNLDVPKSGD